MRATLVLLALVTTACSAATDGTGPELVPDPLRVVIASDPASLPSDPLTVDSARVAGDTLEVHVRYGGGCAEHRIVLVWSGAFLESYPVQVPLVLSHDDGDDPCDAVVSAALRFDLSPVRSAYHGAYGDGGGGSSVLLTLRGLDRPVLYRF